jgi:hypothetical protein
MAFLLIIACFIVACLIVQIYNLNKRIDYNNFLYDQDSNKIIQQSQQIYLHKCKIAELLRNTNDFEKMEIDYVRFKDLVEYYKLCNMLMQAKSYVKIYNMQESLFEWIKESKFDKQTEQQYLELVERIK